MTEPRVSSRTALVTGASRGIGRAIVEALLARGFEVDALALDDEHLARLAAETAARPIGVDVRDVAALEAALGETAAALGEATTALGEATASTVRPGYDVVVNNAGVLPELKPFGAVSSASIDLLVDVNLRAALHVTRLVLPGMLERDHGHLIFMGSIAGRHPGPNAAVYAATKAAIHSFAEGVRLDVHGSAVRVTVLMPGRVETSLYDGHFGDHERAAAALYDGFEAVQPTDIAGVVLAAIDMPPYVDLTAIEVLPTRQVFGGSSIAKAAAPAASRDGEA